MNSPTVVASAPCFCDLSLNCVIRDACPKPVKQPSTQANSAWAGTWLCTKTVAARRVDAQRQVLRGGDQRAPAQHGRVLRDGDRMQVDDAEVRVVAVLQPDPLADRAQRVAEVQGVRRGLRAGEDDAALVRVLMMRSSFHAGDAYSTVTGA